jgi:hypothetical protein
MTQEKIDANVKLAEDKDFKQWIDNNVYHLVNQVMDIWYQDDTEEPHAKVWIATKNAITSEDIEDFRQGYDPENLPDMEDPEFEDAIMEWKQGEVMQHFAISPHLAQWLSTVGEIVVDDVYDFDHIWLKRSFGMGMEYEWGLQQAYKNYQRYISGENNIFDDTKGDCF